MRRFVAGAVAIALATTACATLGRSTFQPPAVALRDVRVNGVGVNGGALDIVLGVYNPNHYSLNALHLDYHLFVDSVPVGSGTSGQTVALTSGDTTEVHLPLEFTWAGVGAAGRQLMTTGSVKYRVQGDLQVDAPYGSVAVPFDRTGRFSSLGGASH